eukprot:792729-Rhodomonas_salina.1
MAPQGPRLEDGEVFRSINRSLSQHATRSMRCLQGAAASQRSCVPPCHGKGLEGAGCRPLHRIRPAGVWLGSRIAPAIGRTIA